MRKIALFLMFITVLSACELIHIGSNKAVKRQIDFDQKSAKGVAFLFLTELDSNNSKAATVLLAKPDGKLMLAIDKYDLYEEMSRLSNLFSDVNITNVRADTISDSSQRISLELNYIRTLILSTRKIKNNWFITDYKYRRKDFPTNNSLNSATINNIKHGS